MIIASPGIALSSAPLQHAAEQGIEIIGDIELFARHVDAPVVGITGSNGKSTVTSLFGEMARAAGIDVGVGGNIGVPALDLLNQSHELYVLELSSFQLETTHSLNMKAATFLNFSEDHMDRYDHLDDYLSAKQRIYTQTEFAVWNHEDEATRPAANLPAVSFGAQGDYSVRKYQGETWLFAKGSPVIATASLGLVGRHNWQNCLAAMALADRVGIDRKAQCRAMKSYLGLPHRCQKVTEQHGVTWINDSKATNPASTLAAIDGLSMKGTLHLLLGGDGKGADFSCLQPVLNKPNVRTYCFGRDGSKLAKLGHNSQCVETLSEAMMLAANAACPDDIVLLSPACASLDQFKNFMIRGDAFILHALALAQSVKVRGAADVV